MTAANANPNAEKEVKTRTPLEPRIIFMIVAGICLVSLLLWFMLHFKARQQQLQDINDQIDSTSTQLTDLQAKQAQIPQLTKDVDGMKKRQAVLEKALPANSEMGQYLDTLRSTVAASGATLDSLTVTAAAGAVGNGAGLPVGVKPQDMNLTVKGNFNSVYKALQGVETTSRFTKVHSVNMTSSQDPTKPEIEPKITAAISMTTYTFDPAAATAAPPAGAAPAAATPAPAAGGKS